MNVDPDFSEARLSPAAVAAALAMHERVFGIDDDGLSDRREAICAILNAARDADLPPPPASQHLTTEQCDQVRAIIGQRIAAFSRPASPTSRD